MHYHFRVSFGAVTRAAATLGAFDVGCEVAEQVFFKIAADSPTVSVLEAVA